jgi:hypothetical protein
MRYKCLTCDALTRPVYLCAAHSPHVIDVELIERGMHIQPAKLRNHLQSLIDQSEGCGYDALLFAYGLCGQATAGLAARSIPLVIPRAHDCITLFLGSRQRYTDEFINHPGTYWYSQDYIERDDGTGASLSIGSDLDTDLQATYVAYVEKYGKDNADYLMQVMGAWQKHYNRAVFIDIGIGDGSRVENTARQEAERRGWSFERMAGDIVLIRRLLEGVWTHDSDEDYLLVPPGQSVTMTNREDVITCH